MTIHYLKVENLKSAVEGGRMKVQRKAVRAGKQILSTAA